MARITLLTDFGTRDGYVGAMKGVLASHFPGVTVDDVAHDVPRGDVAAGARALARYWRRYPGTTVHLAVVDPGVGTERRAVAVEADRRFLVLPDNGLATHVLTEAEKWQAVELDPQAMGVDAEETSATFHGRDVFAPAAALLARGAHLSRLGRAVEDLHRLPEPEPRVEGEVVVGEVVAADRFGNLITNIAGAEAAGRSRVVVAGVEVPLVRTYGDVEPGLLLALVNSDERIEVAVRDGSAAERLDAGPGEVVRVEGAG